MMVLGGTILGAQYKVTKKQGIPVLNGRIESVKVYKDRDGETHRKSLIYSFRFWGKDADKYKSILAKKGRRVTLSGPVEFNTYTKLKDGKEVQYMDSILEPTQVQLG